MILVAVSACAAPETQADLDFDAASAAVQVVAPDEDAFISLSVERQVAACMQGLGYDYATPTTTTFEIYGVLAVMPRPAQWAFDDVDTAQRSGYGLGVALQSQEGDPFQEFQEPVPEDQLSDEYFNDLLGSGEKVRITELDGSQSGVGTNGCVAEARKLVWGSLENFLVVGDVASHISSAALSLATSDGRVDASLEEWQQCMKDELQGFDEEFDPETAVAKAWDIYGSSTDSEAAAQEVAIATSHATCSSQTGLASRFRDAFAEHTSELIAEFESEILGAQEIANSALERAKAALESARQ